MSTRILTKMVSKKKFKSIITDLEELINAHICIKDATGKVLVGHDEQLPFAYPVRYGEKSVGWVYGATDVRVVADILSFWLFLEHEKKTLGLELLERYREITFYFNIAEQLAGNLEPGDTARFLIEEARKLIKAGDVSIVLIEKDRQELLASSKTEVDAMGIFNACRLVIDSVTVNIKSEVINDFPADQR